MRRPALHLVHAEVLKLIERLHQNCAAGTGRTHRNDVVPEECTSQRPALHRAIRGKVAFGNQAVMGTHLARERVGDPSDVEGIRTVHRD